MNYFKRKRIAIMRLVEGVKGFVRTISGTPPITLPDCVDNDSIINYSISGNSVQNGNPTPENPVEVESVGDYDVETGKYKIPIKMSGKNLFNIDSVSTNTPAVSGSVPIGYYYQKSLVDGEYILKSNLARYAGGTYFSSNIKSLKAGTYTISADVLFPANGMWYALSFAIVEKNTSSTYYWSSYSGGSASSWKRLKGSIIIPKDIDVLGISMQPSGDSSNWRWLGIQIKNLQIEKSDSVTDYKPYIEPITTNIYLDEPLAEGQTITNPVKLPTIKGTTIYTIETTVQPLNMSAEYYSTSKGE